MNETEAEHYGRKESAEEAARNLPDCRYGGYQDGQKGSIAVKDGRLYQAAPYTVEAVDTTGAGDSFNAGFVYGFLRGKSMEECLKCGNGCGALSVTVLGGTDFRQRRSWKHLSKTRKLLRETNRDNKEEKVMKNCSYRRSRCTYRNFYQRTLKRYKNFTLTKSYSTISRKKNRESLKSYVNT